MKTIGSMVGRSLQWVQSSMFKSAYELRAGDIVVAKVEWSKAFSMVARAESADGCWEFDRVGIWHRNITVRACGGETPIAVFEEDRWRKNQTLALPSGETLIVTSNFWRSTYELQTETGELLVQVKPRGFFRREFEVELRRRGVSYPEFPWLVMLVWYLILNARGSPMRTRRLDRAFYE